MFVLAPGFQTPFIPLNEAMRLARENQIAEHNARAEKRKASGAPQSDNVDYGALAETLEVAKKAAEAGDDPAIFEAVDGIAAHLGAAARPPAPFEPDPALDGLTVSNTLLSRAEWTDGFADVALDPGGPALGKLLEKCVRVEGFTVEGEMQDGPELWEHAGIHGHLLAVARHFQTITFEEKKRYGSPTP
jgi:hypothetical protein